jgi:hypothetical protein
VTVSDLEILRAIPSGVDNAVFVVVIDGRRIELPWVEHASLRDGILVLEAVSSGSGSAAATWMRVWDQAAWQSSANVASAP